jgi:hypothetical protein
MTRSLTHLHIETGPGGWLKAFWRRGADEPENVIYCRFRAPKTKRQGWALIGLQASQHSRPTRWLSSELLDDVPRHRIELAVVASDVFRDGLLEAIDDDVPSDLDAAFARAYHTAPRPKLERPRRSELDDAFYRRVALAYRRAVAAGLPPSKTLAEDAETPPGTVNRWIAEARKRGHLPKTERGKVST